MQWTMIDLDGDENGVYAWIFRTEWGWAVVYPDSVDGLYIDCDAAKAVAEDVVKERE